MSPSSETKPRKSRPFRWAASLFAVALVAGGIAVGGGWITLPADAADTPATTVIEPDPTMRVLAEETYTLVPRDLRATVSFTGTVQPAQRADISVEVSGIAATVNVREGEQVAAGDILLEIDAADLMLQLRQQQSAATSAEVQLAAAQQTLERTRTLAERGLSPENTLDAAVTEVDRLEASLVSARTQVEQVEADIARTIVRAPFSGTVAMRAIEPGQVVSPGAAVFTLVDMSRATIDALVPLAMSDGLAVGQSATVSVQGIADTVFVAEIDRINPIASEGTRSIAVHLTLDNPGARLRGGMFATGAITVASSVDTLAVPLAAVLGERDASYVLAVDDETLVRRDIVVAETWDRLDAVEIATGLTAGDVIVARPLEGLAPGQRVAVGAQ